MHNHGLNVMLFYLIIFWFGLVCTGGYVSNGTPTQGFQSDGDSTNTTVSLLASHGFNQWRLSFFLPLADLCVNYRYLLEGLILMLPMKISGTPSLSMER